MKKIFFYNIIICSIIISFIYSGCTLNREAAIKNEFEQIKNIQKNPLILVLPFKNNTDIHLDYISELIPNSFNILFKDRIEYNTVPVDELKSYLTNNNYTAEHYFIRSSILTIADYFKADMIIRGQYTEKEGLLFFDVEMIESHKKKIIYRSSKFGPGGIQAFDTLNEIINFLIEDITGLKFETGILNVNTERPCFLYIDDEFYCETPVRIPIVLGKHNVKIIYSDTQNKKTIWEGSVNLTSNEEKKLDINVFTVLNITAEDECIIYIDGEKTGNTPFSGNLLSGNEYDLKIIYQKGEIQEIVSESVISTKKKDIINLFFPVTGALNLLDKNKVLHVDLINESLSNSFNENIILNTILPFSFNSLPLGNYRLKVFVQDPESQKRYYFYNKTFYLSPGIENIKDLSSINYEKKPGLSFIPSAAQYHNKQKRKGTIILTAFLVSATFTVLFPVLYYKLKYKPMEDTWNSGNPNKYSRAEIDSAYNVVIGTFTAGLILTTSIYIYSLADGMINMKRLHNIFHPEK